MYMLNMLLTAMISILFHDFHVSVTNVEFKKDSGSLQISMKVFLDDLEAALRDKGHVAVSIKDAGVDPAMDKLVFDYLQEKFTLESNGETLALLYVGHEIEVDICFIYMEVANFPVDKELFVGNSLFFDRFEDQSNIVNIRYREEVYSVFLDRNHPVKKVRFD